MDTGSRTLRSRRTATVVPGFAPRPRRKRASWLERASSWANVRVPSVATTAVRSGALAATFANSSATVWPGRSRAGASPAASSDFSSASVVTERAAVGSAGWVSNSPRSRTKRFRCWSRPGWRVQLGGGRELDCHGSRRALAHAMDNDRQVIDGSRGQDVHGSGGLAEGDVLQYRKDVH